MRVTPWLSSGTGDDVVHAAGSAGDLVLHYSHKHHSGMHGVAQLFLHTVLTRQYQRTVLIYMQTKVKMAATCLCLTCSCAAAQLIPDMRSPR